MSIRTYSELSALSTFEDRYEYLRLDGVVGRETFGYDRYLNQYFYNSLEWKAIREEVILRDNGCDLGVQGYEINGFKDSHGIWHKPLVLIHHLNPITKRDILNKTDILLDPEYLITTTKRTHDAIHYGTDKTLISGLTVRKKNDTCPWK